MAAIRKVGVLGCGLMGSGIAQLCAQAGYETVVRELSDDLVERGLGNIRKQLARQVEKEKITASDRDATLAHLRGTTRLDDLADRDLIIEAVVEDLEVKNEIWRTLDGVCSPSTIFAVSTVLPESRVRPSCVVISRKLDAVTKDTATQMRAPATMIQISGPRKMRLKSMVPARLQRGTSAASECSPGAEPYSPE